MHVHKPRVLKALRYRYKGVAVVYIIRHMPSGMQYVGSTFTPMLRFHQHLVTGTHSNVGLQSAIAQHGLSEFVVYVVEVVEFGNMAQSLRKAHLLAREQSHMDRYPATQL
jgi:predicted GIY-YIG superfamily endonuclease